MNKTEERFSQHLERLADSEFVEWGFEQITLKLAPDTRYTPDFHAIGYDSILRFFEVKGFFRDDAKVKLKVAAEKFGRIAMFYLAREKPKKLGGGWDIEEVGA